MVISTAGICLTVLPSVGFLTAGIPISRRPNRHIPLRGPPVLTLLVLQRVPRWLLCLCRRVLMCDCGGVLAESGDTPMHSAAIIDVSRSSSYFAKCEASGGKAQHTLVSVAAAPIAALLGRWVIPPSQFQLPTRRGCAMFHAELGAPKVYVSGACAFALVLGPFLLLRWNATCAGVLLLSGSPVFVFARAVFACAAF